MPVLEITFPAGRYHATAWGRNVNEGDPEWPPSPFRLARALMDMRYRRFEGITDSELEAALLPLVGTPRFSLPPVSKMAVKCYLDQGAKELDRQPVLDAFVCLGKKDALYMELPEAPAASLWLLEQLAGALPYLGRSESWVTARLCDALPPHRHWNCCPAQQDAPLDSLVSVQTLLSPEAYSGLPYLPSTGSGKKKRPCSWLEALALSTKTLLTEGWNRHPLLGSCTYALHEQEMPSTALPLSGDGPCCVTYALRATPLPPVTHGLILAGRIRAGLMSRHKHCCGDPDAVSPLFSGKDASGRPLCGHQHASYWPCDTDGDGKIDHVRVFLPRGLTQDERAALESLRHVWARGAKLAELIYLHCLPLAAFPRARTVVSATPVVFGRHYKARQGAHRDWLEAELRRACAVQGLPEPVRVEPFPFLPIRDGAELPWSSFARQRKDKAPQPGYGFRLHFDSPVPVPFAIGSLAHFGLGLFVADGV